MNLLEGGRRQSPEEMGPKVRGSGAHTLLCLARAAPGCPDIEGKTLVLSQALPPFFPRVAQQPLDIGRSCKLRVQRHGDSGVSGNDVALKVVTPTPRPESSGSWIDVGGQSWSWMNPWRCC